MNMMITETASENFRVEDIEYLRHGDEALLLRLFRPAGDGPFPIVIDLHGGAWNGSDRMSGKMRDEIMVGDGLAVAALEFRQGTHGYPTSLADINYAIRWLKAGAGDLRLDPDRVGITGASSGG
ncbi:MAG: alpha/beta hydrolase, partial [Proteobacteria bacterium]|nr:alpha/beta hydrolase [Pseudomonadota bacterium]